MSALNNSQERNARALEVAGRMVGELVGELRLGMFDPHVTAETRQIRRTQQAEEIGDLTKKLAGQLVNFI
jgi:hypothetical protein